MHSFSETGAGVPAFLAKLWRLVEDPETNNLICWSKDGRSFIIQNQAQFARELLPLNYKHNNMASFIRQLNMYGFHKITSIDNGGLKFDRDEMEFTHPCFKRNCPYLLEHIKRKIASTKSVDEKSSLKPEAVTKVLHDVKAMRGRQDSLDSRFSVMKQENEALWREIASLRQKHAKQQQIVNKLIQFLITIVQPQRNMTSVKRHMQLMINGIPDKSKMRKSSESESECGPVIHELGEDLLDDVGDVESDLMMPHSPFGQPSTPATTEPEAAASPQNIERPHSSISLMSQNFEYSNQSADDAMGGYMSPNVKSGATAQADNLVQTVNTDDGSKIFYHITEVPDAHPQEPAPQTVNYNEENVLTTPMVREQMARTQLLKQKNRQRRNKNGTAATTHTISSSSPTNVAGSVVTSPKQQRVCTSQSQQLQQQLKQVPQPIQIKSEQDVIDPMMYLNVYPDSRVLTPDPILISPNLSEESGSFLLNNNNNNNTSQNSSNPNTISPNENDLLGNNSSDLYNPNSFIANNIPADIFEDNSIMSAGGDNSNFATDDNYKLALQRQFGLNTVNSGKFSSYLVGNSGNNAAANNGAGPSTSAAAAAGMSERKQTMDSIAATPSTSKSNGNNMTVAKFNRGGGGGGHDDVMHNEVTGHLDIVQDELDTLKDLLRSDVYSLDHNTLLGLFNDADILGLGPYGLHLPNDGNNEKKGSELMAYQPMYDLSDIINEQNDLDAETNLLTASDGGCSSMTPQITYQSRSQQQQQHAPGCSSVLNTPYHE